ncbi:kinase-like domain-containing protein [Rhizophagus clarus]|uniref:Kinase-like domain-containing protein n=1 Tax=Rhizophagus clarus TaxID=94130 RepID=A0A8H3QKQ7_9GLOM|nr:kinase-like domain-containing protein [Rhizophagus clarus]
MSTLRYELIYATNYRAFTLIDTNIHDDIHKQHKFYKQFVLDDKILTNDEKTYAVKLLTENYDYYKVVYNSGTKRICENCNQGCLATLYCEYCVRNYLKDNFSNWTSGNDDIDNLIQKCQMESLGPANIVEWFPYNNIKNIKYLTKGGFSEIYTADWIEGEYEGWDSETQQLKRLGNHKVVLKSLENVKSANRSWFEEARSHLTINNKWEDVVRCYGLTQNPSNGNYMLKKMERINLDYQNMPDELFQSETNNLENNNANNLETNYTSSSLFTSKIHNFENFPEPRNAAEEEQEAFHSKSYDFNIPNNINDFNGSNSSSKRIYKVFKKLQISSKDDENGIIHQQIKRQKINIDNDDEIYNNPNLHSNEQDELEIPDNGF